MGDTKEKPKERTRLSPINFIVPMQLEECMYRLEQANSPQLNIELIPYDDYCNFSVNPLLENNSMAKVAGIIRRWEGVSTQFKGDMQIISDEKLASSTGRVLFAFPFFTCGLIYLMTTISNSISTEKDAYLIVLLGVFAGLAGFVIIVGLLQKQIDHRVEEKFINAIYKAPELPTEHD